MAPSDILSTKDLCSLFGQPMVRSVAGLLWSVITALWPWYWFLIVIALTGWITFEIKTRYGTAHYNSENGFSPAFNRFIGSGTYLGLQSFLFAVFHLIFGDAAYCMTWPYAVHAIVFLSTGLLLHLSGFWPYLKESGGGRRKWRRRSARYY
jgi:hypothetical protein